MPLMYNANTPEGTLPSIENISIASLGDANARMNAHPDVASVRRKIASVAAYYDPQRQGGLKGFNGAELDPTALKEQLRRNFGIQVTPAELGALVTLFDKDGDGTVDCSEFLHEFFKIGKTERGKIKAAHDRQKMARHRRQEALKEERRKQRVALTFTHVSSFTEEEKAAALHKIAIVAAHFDATRHGSLDDFVNGDEMSPTVFREQLRRNFGILLTSAELGAMFDYFDADGGGTIDGAEFLSKFFKIGVAARERKVHHRRQLEQKTKVQKEEFKRSMHEKYGKLVATKVDDSWTDEDQKAAVLKIRKVARFYDGGRGGGLKDLSDAHAMDATVFKEQLKAMFNIHLTPKELSALIAYFDQDGDMRVDGAEFLSVFFREGKKEKAKIRRKHKLQEARIAEHKEGMRLRQIDKFAKQVEAKIIWPSVESLKPPKIKTNAKPSEMKKWGSVSPGTLDFLQELEAKEKEIKQMDVNSRYGDEEEFGEGSAFFDE